MKLLLLIHELSLSGAPKLTLTLFEAIEGLEVWTVALRGGELATEFERLGKVTILTQRGSFLSRRLPQSFTRKLFERRLQRWRPDIIYASSVAALAIPRRISLPAKPAILHVHEIGSTLRQHLREFGTRLRDWPDKFVTVTERVRQTLVEEVGLTANQIALIPACVRDVEFERTSCLINERNNSSNAKTFVVGGAGRAGWVKALPLWLLMAVELQTLFPDQVRFRWIGVDDGEPSENFREMANKLGLSQVIEFVPVTNDPLPHLQSCDVFAMTSWEESASLVTLESMMLEVPVVCFRGSGGPVELLGETGCIVDQFDPRAMAYSIASLFNNPEQRKELGRAARKRVAMFFLESKAAPQLERVLRETAGSPRVAADARREVVPQPSV